jgi:hypothetical protein
VGSWILLSSKEEQEDDCYDQAGDEDDSVEIHDLFFNSVKKKIQRDYRLRKSSQDYG